MIDFYYRVFTTIEKNIWADEIENFVNNTETLTGWSVYGIVDEEEENNLDAVPVQIVFTDEQGQEIAFLEYDLLEHSETLKEELDELQKVVDMMEPERNREWAHKKLLQIKGCYAFKVCDAALEDPDLWDGLVEIATWLRSQTNGIEQTDDGQLTNEDGSLILTVPDDLESDEEDEFEEVDVLEDDEIEEDEESEDEQEEEDDEDTFIAALWSDNGWVEKKIDSDEAFEAFIRGEE